MSKIYPSVKEKKLILLLNNDNEEAFNVIYKLYHAHIYNLGIRYLKSPVLAQQLVQDVFTNLWSQRKNIQLTYPLKVWLFTSCKNNIINRLKSIAIEHKASNQQKDNHNFEKNALEVTNCDLIVTEVNYLFENN